MKPAILLSIVIAIAGQLVNYALCKPCYEGSSHKPIPLGVNYGMVADNLPPPSQVAKIVKSLYIDKVKIYSTNASVLTAFANTGVSFIVGIGNENLHSLTNPQNAIQWVKENIVPFLPNTLISSIAVGNEVLTTNGDVEVTAAIAQPMDDLLVAMQNLHSALQQLDPPTNISISTPHSLAILASSYPPSTSTFHPSLAITYLKPLLLFLSETGAPFMINAYPYFAYKGNPTTISLPYVLFQNNGGVQDSKTGVVYYNMLEAQVDAVYASMEALGHDDVKVVVTETGWPSKGDPEEPGANKKNAQIYNSNLIARVASQKGTPMRPKIPLEVYVFALFNEYMKPGPISERNYGLFNPDGSQSYNLGLSASDPQFSSCNVYSFPSASTNSSTSSSSIPITKPNYYVYTMILTSLLCQFIKDILV